MQATCEIRDQQINLILSDVAPPYQQAVRDLGYRDAENGFCKTLHASTPDLDHICRHFAQHAEEMVLQTARVHAAPWEQALHAFLDRVEQHQINWWLGGSAALAVRGFEVTPRDLDLVTDEQGAHQLGRVLRDYLIEPVAHVDWFCSRWGRAFLHARIEWVGGVNERADQPFVTDFGPTAAASLETVDWHGHPIRVPPLMLQLHVSQRRGLTDRVQQIKQALTHASSHPWTM